MSKTVIPGGYHAKLDLYCTQDAIVGGQGSFFKIAALGIGITHQRREGYSDFAKGNPLISTSHTPSLT